MGSVASSEVIASPEAIRRRSSSAMARAARNLVLVVNSLLALQSLQLQRPVHCTFVNQSSRHEAVDFRQPGECCASITWPCERDSGQQHYNTACHNPKCLNQSIATDKLCAQAYVCPHNTVKLWSSNIVRLSWFAEMLLSLKASLIALAECDWAWKLNIHRFNDCVYKKGANSNLCAEGLFS